MILSRRVLLTPLLIHTISILSCSPPAHAEAVTVQNPTESPTGDPALMHDADSHNKALSAAGDEGVARSSAVQIAKREQIRRHIAEWIGKLGPVAANLMFLLWMLFEFIHRERSLFRKRTRSESPESQ